MRKSALLILACLGVAQFSSAAPATCAPGTLASYMALGAGGCMIGTNLLANFTQGPMLNATTTIPAASLNIIPSGGSTNPGIIVTASLSATNGQLFSTLINYTISGNTFTSDTITLSNTVMTGNGAVTDIQNFCPNGNFTAPSWVSGCPSGNASGSPQVVVGNGSSTATLSATSIGITHNLEIDPGTGTASGAVVVDQFGVSGGTSAPTTFTTVSAGNWLPNVAPNSIAAGFGSNIATATTAATQLPLPVSLGGITVSITDSAGTTVAAPLFMVSAGQVNYLIPSTVALGAATVKVSTGSTSFTGSIQINNVAPAIFTADSSGSGPPAAQVVRVSGGQQSLDPAPFTAGTNGSPATPAPIKLSPATDSIFLMLYGTGIQRHTTAVTATIGGISVPVPYAGAQSTLAGLDQVNLGPLPQSLAGKGAVSVIITVDGIPANTLSLNFQ